MIPDYIREMAHPSRRKQLEAGIWSGYGLALIFALLAFVGGLTDVVPQRPGFYVLVGVKLLTNTLNWWSLKRDRAVMFFQLTNTIADLVVMTGAIYLTGGPLSPLLPIYVILVAILGVLSNPGTTFTAAALAWAMHAGACMLVQLGVVPHVPPPGMPDAVELEGWQLAVALLYAAILLGVTGAATTLLVRERGEKQAQLERRTSELLEAHEQRSMLMANVTHELRTPIHAIRGLTDVLDAEVYGEVTEEQREAFENIREAAGGLLHVVDDLLALTKSEAGALELRVSEVKLAEVLESVAGSVRWMLGRKELTLEVVDGAPGHVMQTDRGKLARVLVNLLSNAAKFTPEGGCIILSAKALDGGVELTVEDDGIGISPEMQARIFEPFRQVDGSDERGYGGVGLGLAIVDRLVRMLGGDVEVESEPGEGTIFTIRLPDEAPPQAA